MESLTLWDYSDRELLHIVLDVMDADSGYASTEAIAERLDAPHANTGIRLAWLKRYGAVTKHENRSLWALTNIGEDLINGDLSNAQRGMVDGLASDRLLMLTRALAERYGSAGVTASHLMRREWKRRTERQR